MIEGFQERRRIHLQFLSALVWGSLGKRFCVGKIGIGWVELVIIIEIKVKDHIGSLDWQRDLYSW